MRKKLFFILALLCAMVQGVKADDGWDVWDGYYDFTYSSLNNYMGN